MKANTVRLRPGSEKRLLRGHRWVFSNEIEDPLSDYEPGSWVEVISARGGVLGSGYINPRSLIAVRLVCPPGQEPTREFFQGLFEKAALRRRSIYPESSCYRLVYGEADGLPGLVVDRYGEVLVYQITTLGMARLELLMRELMEELVQPEAMVYRHDTEVRRLEGLELEKGVAGGEVADHHWVELDGLEVQVAPLAGQKTGLYLDQRENVRAFRRWARDRRVLDLFCYGGAWGLAAAAAGAREVVGVDQSGRAVEQARANARRNRLDDRCRFERAEALSFLRTVEKGSFDAIVVDPPAFAKTKSVLREAQKGYVDLNRRALLALEPGGLLVTCSCSYHVSEELFRELLVRAGQASGRQLRLLEARGQAPDHPVLLAMPETRYLKCLFVEVM